jgi:hypothetical protein
MEQPMSVQRNPSLASFDDVSGCAPDAGLEPALLRGERLRCFTALAAGAAHELNNLLATVLMGVELLRQGCREAPERGVLSTLEETARRGLHTTRQLQWLARGAEGEVTLFQPRFLIADLQQLMRATSPETLVVVTEYPADLWLLEGDPLSFYHLLLALLLEGREALGGNGTLTVSARNGDLAAAPAAPGAPADNGAGPGARRVVELIVSRGAAPAADGGKPVPPPIVPGDGARFEALVLAAGGHSIARSPAAGGGRIVLLPAAVARPGAGVPREPPAEHNPRDPRANREAPWAERRLHPPSPSSIA